MVEGGAQRLLKKYLGKSVAMMFHPAMTATAAPFTEVESLYIVVSAKGKGHTTGSLGMLKALATKEGGQLTWRTSRIDGNVVMIMMNGHNVSRGFRSRAKSFEFFTGLNA